VLVVELLIIVIKCYFSYCKTKAEITAQKASHAARERSRRERREEQERNVQRKKVVLAEKAKTVVADTADADANATSEEREDEEEDNGNAPWDNDEEMNEGEVTEGDSKRRWG